MHDLAIQKIIFKGYRLGKSDKIPRNNQLYTYDEVKASDNYGATCQDDIVDISIDDIDMFDAFLNLCDDLGLSTYALYSPHGGHTFWRYTNAIVNGKDKLVASGFTVDIHNKGTYIPLKCSGQLRNEVYDKIDDVSILPKLFLPIKDVTNNPLWGLKEGDGRNDALSKHAFMLSSKLKMTKEEIISTSNIINKYVFKEPLSDSELRVILRDDTFDRMQSKSFFNGKTFLHNAFGDYLIDKYRIVSIDNHLHTYNGKIYEHLDGDDNIFNVMINEIPTIKEAQRVETIKYIKIRAQKCDVADERYVAFANGIYDIYQNALLDFSDEIYITIQIPWNYNANAYDELTDITLNKIACDDVDVRLLLEECIGYCFYRRNELGSSFFLIGDKSNGKSTFLKMIKNMLGKKNYSPLDLSELSDRFNTAMMCGKLANIGDDIDDEYLSGTKVAIFKKLVTGDTIKAEEKNQPIFMFEPFVKLFFAANEMPKIKDKTGAVLRRIVIVPFNAIFDKNDSTYKHNIIKDLITKDATEYLIKLGIDGLQRILSRQGFTQPECVTETLKEYERNNDAVMQFIDDLPNGIDDIINENCDDVFARYQSFCAKNGYQYTGIKNTFSSSLRKKYNIDTSQVRINGKRFRIYTQK